MTIDIMESTPKNIPRANFDSPWKHSLAFYFRDFLEFCLPHISEQIDWSKGYESLDKELNTITRGAEIGNRIADKLIKIHKKDGKEALVLCHIEVDGNPKNKLPKRMMIYRYRIYDLHQLPIISIAILIDDDPNWRVDSYKEECFGTYHTIRYIIVKLLDYQKRWQELEVLNNRFAVVMLAQLAVLETKHNPKARLNAKTALTRQLYEKGYTKQDIIQLFILIDWLITLPEELVVQYNQTLIQIEEERKVQFITTPQRVGRMEGFREGFQDGMQKGIEEGIKEGVEQGIKEGVEQGIKQGEAGMLMCILQQRFSHIPSNYLEQIEQADTNTLLLWGRRILKAKTLEEIFT